MDTVILQVIKMFVECTLKESTKQDHSSQYLWAVYLRIITTLKSRILKCIYHVLSSNKHAMDRPCREQQIRGLCRKTYCWCFTANFSRVTRTKIITEAIIIIVLGIENAVNHVLTQYSWISFFFYKTWIWHIRSIINAYWFTYLKTLLCVWHSPMVFYSLIKTYNGVV